MVLPNDFKDICEQYGLSVHSQETSPTFEGEEQYLHLVSKMVRDEYYSHYLVRYAFISCGNYFRIVDGMPSWFHKNELTHKLKAFIEFYGIGDE